MRRRLTDHQRQCVEAIIHHVTEYLDLRYVMTVRANPRYENPWPTLQFLLIQQLRNTLENDKMWGPERFVVGEVFCSTERDKVRDLFNPTNQRSVLNEIVDRQEDAAHKTADVLEIHDFQTLYGAIDPGIAKIASVIQVYAWWDLPDATDLARFRILAQRFQALRRECPDSVRQKYAAVMKKSDNELPTQKEILEREAGELRDIVQTFAARRVGEPGYKLIIAERTVGDTTTADNLISTIARELILLRSIEAGQQPDDNIKQQFARALHTSVNELTSEKEIEYLRHAIAEGKARLRREISSFAGGEPYNFKAAQADDLHRKYQQLVGQKLDENESGAEGEAPDRAAAGGSR